MEEAQQGIDQLQEVYDIVAAFLVNYSFQIVGALIILLLGLVVAAKASGGLERTMLRHRIDVTLSRFTARASYLALVAVTVVMALGKLGISITPFVAAVGAVSLGAGLAMQGVLSNYGAGVTIIVTRPYVVGDTITVQGVTGVVQQVELGQTVLTNEDNVQITIPNKHIVGEIIHNSFANSIVETTLTIAYDADTDLAIRLMREAINGTAGVAPEPAAQVGIEDFGASGYTMGIRYWARTTALFQTRYAVNARIREALSAQRIAPTYPQHQVRVLQ